MGESKRKAKQPKPRQFNKIDLTERPDIPVMAGKLELGLLQAVRAEALRQRTANPQSFNHGLAGMIKEEYHFNPEAVPGLLTYIEEMYETYNRHFDLFGDKVSCLGHLWANFQKKHEFNPIHNHTGAVSFTMWIQIPYDLAAEQAQFPQGTVNVTSNFAFVYSGTTEDIVTYNFPVQKDWEGMIVMWPSWLRHMVNPFYTSDDYRISIAGNIYVLGENYKCNSSDDPDEIIRQTLALANTTGSGQ
jgi:hypothetical protein